MLLSAIGNLAFYNCNTKSLTSIVVPYSVTSVGELAFASCSSLTSVTISDSVETIADNAFEKCNALKTIYGYSGSAAQAYAEENNIPFISIGGETEETTFKETSDTTTTTSTTKKETTTMTIITETTPVYSESIVLSIRPEKTSYTVTTNNNVIYLQKENLPDTLHLGVYIDKYDSPCSNLMLKLCSDTDKITFIEDTFCNPDAYRYDEARTYTLSDGTTFSTKFQPYALGRINSAGNYEPGCFLDKADFDSTGKEMTFTWNYDSGSYDTSGSKLRNALLLTDIPDELSFIEFDVKLNQTISPGSYQLYFYTNEAYNDSTYVTLDESTSISKSIKKFPLAVRNLSIVVLPEEIVPEPTSTTTTATTKQTTSTTTTKKETTTTTRQEIIYDTPYIDLEHVEISLSDLKNRIIRCL